MAHVEDRWYRKIKTADGGTERVKTDRFGKGDRYRVRFVGPDGREKSQSYPDRAKRAADAFLVSVEADKLRGAYIDPAAGRRLFRDYADTWIRNRAFDESTRESVEIRVRTHVMPFFGGRALASIKPGDISEWDRGPARTLASSTRSVAFAHLSSILAGAVDDGLIAKNPCSAASVVKPRPLERKVIPWSVEEVTAIRSGLVPRYRPLVDVAGGCGMRQGEVFGLAVDDLDFAEGWLYVRRQVKRVRSRLVFGLPKNDRERRVPLPGSVSARLRTYIEDFPPVEVTLPWEDPSRPERVTVRLVFVSPRRNALNRSTVDDKAWRPALISAGIVPTRATGMHALRHFYASALLDGGESIKALSAYLGHSDPGFTLRVYTHLMPASEERTRRAIDALFDPPHGPVTAQSDS